MYIPKGVVERHAFYQDMLRKCTYTRAERRARYSLLRMYYMFGCDPGLTPNAIFNKIYPSIDQISSFMYSQETTRFTIDLGESVSTADRFGEIRKVPPMTRMLAKDWNASNTDIIFGSCLPWSFCLGSMFIKAVPGNEGIPTPHPVDPDDFSVLREDVIGISNQEAFVHSYLITKSQLSNELETAEHKNRDSILSLVSGSPRTNDKVDGGTFNRIIVSSVQPNIVGSLRGGMWTNITQVSRPKIAEPLIEMHELYVYDDEHDDYRLVTIASPEIVIWDRPLSRAFVKNESPFVQICPLPAKDYFYGYSEVEGLIPLQEKLNLRIEQIDHLLELQAKPPKSLSGYTSGIDEMALALDSPNGIINSDMPGAKTDVHQPSIPEDLYKEVREIYSMFEERIGLTNVNQGRGEVGVRSTGQASLLSKLGSSRAKKKALTVEDSLEKLATLYVQIKRRYSKGRMRADGPDGEEFIAAQFTDDFLAKVDAHSNSPIFMEEHTELAFKLFEAKAIDRDELLMLLDVPMKELLREKLRTKIEPAEAAQAAQQLQLEAQKHSGKKAA